MFDEAFVHNNEKQSAAGRKRVHIPFCDVDDLAFKNRHDPNFIANITKIMQVPATITLNSDSNNGSNRMGSGVFNDVNSSYPMDIPEKLTADGIITSRADLASLYDTSGYDENNEYHNHNGVHAHEDGMNDTTATPPSTPTRAAAAAAAAAGIHIDETGRTPQIAADLYKRMRPRRTSIEADLHSEIRILRDKINNLEHECQVNTRSCRIFYALLCGYILLKSFSWLINK